MMKACIRRVVAILLVACSTFITQAQTLEPGNTPKPYKILTSGRQVTVKSSKPIQSIMVWTASGHRIVEQREIKESSFSFTINVSEKVFFLMIHIEGSRPFTEKIGVR